MATETIEVTGHIVDSLILAKILDAILEAGADYEIADVDDRQDQPRPSRAPASRSPATTTCSGPLLDELQVHGANRVDQTDAAIVAADRRRRAARRLLLHHQPGRPRCGSTAEWVPVDEPRDGLRPGRRADGHAAHRADAPHPRRRPRSSSAARACGSRPRRRPRGTQPVRVHGSEVSSEKPKALLVAQVAERMRAARGRGRQGAGRRAGRRSSTPAARPTWPASSRAGWVDVLFAGNGFATHDIESNVLGTSLGVSVAEGTPTEGGHANHLRVINEVRRHGSIAAAVDAGFVTGGVMYECVRHGRPVRAGRLDPRRRPAARRHHRHGGRGRRHAGRCCPACTVALMLASTLHAIATGNCLPAGVETFCVDINQAVVTKLADRGSHQALGIVTDVGLFVRQLADHLVGTA